MSLFGAMFSGVSGLNAQSQSLGMISDNISNVNTVGFKATEARFSTLVTQAATDTSYSPGGVEAAPFSLIDKQGLLESSDSATDIAVAGKGFFVVNTRDNSAGQFLFTRAGSFTVDQNGFLKNTGGYFLQGWPTDTAGVPIAANTSIESTLSTVNVSGISGVAVATSNVSLGANLPASAPTGTTENNNILIFDSLGVAHNIQITWTKTGVNAWDYAVADPTLANDASVQTATLTAGAAGSVTFNGDGTPNTITNPALAIDFTNPPATATGAAAGAITLDLGTAGSADGVTQFSGNFTTSFIQQNGVQFGIFTGVTIGEDGLVTATFDNGETRPIYKVPLATFANPSRLEAKSGNAYAQTDRSGQTLLNFADELDSSRIASGALESSNVDLGEEFTKMVITQQAYSAASRIITTADEMLDELVRIIR
ncbi:MAG: flagellar hook protein FlgE [Alphaproteobacteria bacterium]